MNQEEQQDKEQAAERETPRKRRRRWPWILLAVLLLLALAVVAGLPFAIEWGAEYWLAQQGRLDAQIANVDFNVFTGRLLVEGLAAGDTPGERLAVEEFYADLDWRPLFSKRLFLPELRARGVAVDLQRRPDGTLVVGGLRLPARGEQAGEEQTPWGIGLEDVRAEAVTVGYRDALLNTEAVVESARLYRLKSWEPDTDAAFSLRLAWNAATARAEGTVRPFARPMRASADLDTDGIRLEWLGALAEQFGIEELEGGANADGRAEMRFDPGSGDMGGTWNGALSAEGVSVQTAGILLENAALQQRGALELYRHAGGPAAKSDGTLEAGADRFDITPVAAEVREARFGWEGTAVFVQADGGRAAVDGTLAASTKFRKDLSRELGAPVLAGQAEDAPEPPYVNAGWNAETGIKARVHLREQTLAATLKGTIQLSEAEGRTPDLSFSEGGLSWDGTVTAEGALNAPAVRAEGALAVSDYASEAPAFALALRQRQFQWEGSFEFAPESEALVSAEGSLSGADLVLHDTAAPRDLARLAAFNVQDVAFSGPLAMRAGSSRLEGVRLLQQELAEGVPEEVGEYVAAVEKLEAEDIAVGRERARVAQVRVQGLHASVVRGAEGQLLALAALPAPPSAAPADSAAEESAPLPAEAPEAAPAEPGETAPDEAGGTFALELGRLELRGDNRVVFYDASVSPSVKLAADKLQATFEGFDTSKPGESSKVALETRLGQYAKLKVSGTVAPLAGAPSVSLEGSLESAELSPFTPYAQRYIGYRLKRGQLSADFNVELAASKLDSETKLSMHKLQIERLKAGELDKLSTQLGMPLNTALSLLRDKQGDINLTIPVTGDLAQPDIGLGDAIQQATGKALKTGIMTVFAPVGVAVLAGKALGGRRLKFETVDFAPVERGLDSSDKAYLDTLADILEERPEVRLELCGFAAPADRQALQQAAVEAAARNAAISAEGESQPAEGVEPAGAAAAAPPEPPEVPEAELLSLAEDRAGAVKNYLAGQHNIDPGRLFTCAPEFDDSAESAPRVEIGL